MEVITTTQKLLILKSVNLIWISEERSLSIPMQGQRKLDLVGATKEIKPKSRTRKKFGDKMKIPRLNPFVLVVSLLYPKVA